MSDLNDEINRRVALDYAVQTSCHSGVDAVLEAARRYDDYLHAQTNRARASRIAELENALREINVELTIPAAEQVPAIYVVWAIIEKALGVAVKQPEVLEVPTPNDEGVMRLRLAIREACGFLHDVRNSPSVQSAMKILAGAIDDGRTNPK